MSNIHADESNNFATLTFVTCYLHDKENSPRNDEWNVGRLAELVSIGVPLYIFVSSENADEIAFLQGAKNIHIEVVTKPELWVFQQLANRVYSLPQYRNLEKDTGDHLAISHSKVELVSMAIEHNPWKTSHFAYVDFNITYLFLEKETTYAYIQQLSKRAFSEKMLMFPGCSGPKSIDYIDDLANSIYWRFCGGFFIGDATTLQSWWKEYQTHFVEYLNIYSKLTWDVNFLAWMETAKRWEPQWYSANHNDSIVSAVSADSITKNMVSVSRRIKYHYPVIPQYRPTSASYLKTPDGRRWLNTRYVNYWLYNNGCYGYPTSSHIIKNQNMLCQLDENMSPIIETFVSVDEIVDLPKYEGDVISEGLEDIRLYITSNEVCEGLKEDIHPAIKFIATNVNYSPTGNNNMVIGNYSLDNHCISNVRVILPSGESWCEKNWIPIPVDGEDLFIYKWCPLEIGRISNDNGTLEIVRSYSISAPFFNKVRGSTTFMENADGLLGVVHFSEDHTPRHYYHILVLLEKHTLKPLKYSNCFCFKSLGVEFCIGFTDEMNSEYVFWTSQMDRDPMTVFIPKVEIPLCFDF